MVKWILKILRDRLAKKKHDVIRLRWQQAELQQALDHAKRDQEGVNHE